MRFFNQTLLAVSTLVFCGVLAANPTTKDHNISNHLELYRPAYCAASYLLVLETLPTSGVPGVVTQDLVSRGTGLFDSVGQYVTSSTGHTIDEWDSLATHVYKWIKANETGRSWIAQVEEFQCKELTEPWAVLELPDDDAIWL